MTIINESGLYSLIFSSKLSSAKQFKRWVTSEVLPAIRKTGKYHVEPEPQFEEQQFNFTFSGTPDQFRTLISGFLPQQRGYTDYDAMQLNSVEHREEQVGEILQLMREKHVSGTDLADMIGVSKSTMSKYLLGRYVPNTQRCYQMLTALREL